MEEILAMNNKEIERLKILEKVRLKELTQVTAAKMLDIGDRQVRNLLKRVKVNGNKGIISRKRGRSSNHQLPRELKEKCISLIAEHYFDFGPTLASEYLQRYHQIRVSPETIRLWMIEKHLWFVKNRKKIIHPLRARRSCFGELIQVDGSKHDWFEGRAPECVLMVYIDDATSEITSLHFSKTESLLAYYQGLEKHLKTYGIPLALYGDRCSVLTPRNPKDNEDSTQFKLALNELNTKLILAKSPEAKGRVERANKTLQDRLIKYLRIKGITTIEEANAILEEYRVEHNQLFSKKTDRHENAHRSLEGILLENVLCIRQERTLSNDQVVQFKNTFYRITSQSKKVSLFKKAKIEIRTLINGSNRAFFKGVEVEITPLSAVECPILDNKETKVIKLKEPYIPHKDHPYKKGYHMKEIFNEIVKKAV